MVVHGLRGQSRRRCTLFIHIIHNLPRFVHTLFWWVGSCDSVLQFGLDCLEMKNELANFRRETILIFGEKGFNCFLRETTKTTSLLKVKRSLKY